jgi:hypothetical protein
VKIRHRRVSPTRQRGIAWAMLVTVFVVSACLVVLGNSQSAEAFAVFAVGLFIALLADSYATEAMDRVDGQLAEVEHLRRDIGMVHQELDQMERGLDRLASDLRRTCAPGSNLSVLAPMTSRLTRPGARQRMIQRSRRRRRAQ